MSEPAPQEGSDGRRLAELAKRRGFFFPSYESYGGVAGFYTYGPRGAAMKRRLEEAWRDRFTVKEDNFEIAAPTVTPETVLEASGHVAEFDDMLVECGSCGRTHRADHLIEDATAIDDAERLPIAEVEELLREQAIECPVCGSSLADQPVESFNLMFETTIGPGAGSRGFLRPETAQSIFAEFPRLAEYARDDLPFGVTQIGPGYRNEISPRRGLVRVREFTMAELELFIDPERNEPDVELVADVDLRLYPATQQRDAPGEYLHQTVGTALGEGVIKNAWIGYYLGVAARWYDRIGISPDRLRFRQHRSGERAHYATDCWDAEAEIDGDWIEIAGFAHRGCYDLERHAAHSSEDYTIFVPHEEPIERERASVDPDMGYLGPTFGNDAPAIADALERLAVENPDAFDRDPVVVSVDDADFEVPAEYTGFAIEQQIESGVHVRPEVIEPSFGVDRTVYAILVHNLREDVIDDEPRTFLSLPADIAPTTVAVFPLMDRDGLGERARDIARSLRSAGIGVTYDDSGNIGRRYRRQDEIGTPYCITVDYDTLADETVTIRERDSTEQIRVAVPELPTAVPALIAGERSIGSD